jgi:hypothetical protein
MTEDPPKPAGRRTAAEAGVLTAPKPCADCSLCCKVLAIPELQKTGGVWCHHIAMSRGCSIYADRPTSCRNYQCVWTLTGPLDERWRPDRAGFLIHPTPVASEIEIIADPDRPDAWRREPYYAQIKQWSDRSNGAITNLLVRAGGRIFVVFPETEIELGGPPSGASVFITSGYETRDGRRQPFARFATEGPGQP